MQGESIRVYSDWLVNCTFGLRAKNSDKIPELTCEYVNDCTRTLAIMLFKLPLTSNYYDELTKQLNENEFSLTSDDGNELIYKNRKGKNCHIKYSDEGTVELYLIKKTNRVWRKKIL